MGDLWYFLADSAPSLLIREGPTEKPMRFIMQRPHGESKRATLVAVWAMWCAAAAYGQTAGSITTVNLPYYAYGPTAIDGVGNLYIGLTNGGGLTATAGAAQTLYGGGTPGECTAGSGTPAAVANPKIGIGPPIEPIPCTDAFLTKLDPNGNVIYGTYLGGPLNDGATAVAVDTAGALYVAGSTAGSFPTTANAPIPDSGYSATFAAKLNPSGSSFVYATYLPATIASVSTIAVDSAGNAYIGGKTTAGHAVVVKLSADGLSFPCTTILTGSGQDSVSQLALDGAGSIVISGQTTSADFPVTAGAAQPTYGGAGDVFVAKLDPAFETLFASYFGGSGAEYVGGMQLDAAGNIYLGGLTSSLDLPTTAASFQPTPLVPLWNSAYPGGFLASLSADGSTLRYSTYFGAPDSTPRSGEVTVSPAGDVYLLMPASAGSPVTLSAPQPCYGGNDDTLLMHFDPQGQLADSTFLGQYGQSLAFATNNYLPDAGSIPVLAASGTLSSHAGVMAVRFGAPGWNAPACLTPALLNSATLVDDGQEVAAGELVTLVGQGIGPAVGVAYQPVSGTPAPTSLGGVQVFFNGIAAPLLYAQAKQVNTYIPAAIANANSVTVTLQYGETTFPTFSEEVTLFDPGLFRLQPGIAAQAVAANQDGIINGPANPAPAGSFVSLLGTGFGPLTTPCSDGGMNVYGPDNLAPSYWASVQGAALVLASYVGGAPDLFCGVVQINVQIPASTPPGPLALRPVSQRQSGNSDSYRAASTSAIIFVK
jgi:uncharacterized protein (TIGR03437 family)